MDWVCEELDEVRAQLEEFKEECRAKKELSDSLRKAHNEQVIKFQEAKVQIEKQAQELNVKSEEIAELKQLYEDLKSSFNEKDSLLKHLNFANEILRADYGGRFQKLEGENKELAMALDEATTRIQVLESKICSGNEEVEGLKRLLSNKQKKCFEADQKAMVSKELKQRLDTILKQEEENRHIQEQLKWKNEQFVHLEEAHRRLQDQFRSSKADWERERSALVEEISSLQTNLDSQTRTSETLQTQLKMCNQALAHEESRRKILEVEVSELKLHFENVFENSHETNSKIEHLTLTRDEEIGNLRNLLGTKETLSKEMEHRIAHLEQEKQGLNVSLKESQIINAGMTSSLKKLENKIQDLEQLHKNCLIDLQKKKVEWSSEIEKLTAVVEVYISKLKGKNEQIQELRKDLEGYNCLLEVQNEETCIVMMILKSEFAAAYSKLFSAKSEMELCNKEREEKILLLTEELEMKDSALHTVQDKFEQKCEEVASLMETVESFDCMKQHQSFLEEELQRHKKMLAESSNGLLCLKEQVMHMESALEMKNHDSSKALEKANSELSKKITEANQADVELQKWKSIAENLKVCLEESQEATKKENENFQGLMKERDDKIFKLQLEHALLESRIADKTEAMEALKQEKEDYIRSAEDDRSTIENLQNEIVCLKQNFTAREVEGALAQADSQKAFEQEKKSLLHIIRDKEQRIEQLLNQTKLTDHDFRNASICFIEKQIEIDVLGEALEKAGNMKKVGIEEKEKLNAILKVEVNDLQKKLECQKESLLHVKQEVEQLEALQQANNCELEKVKNQSASERRQLEGLVNELEFQKGVLLEGIMKVSADRDDLLIRVEGFCDQINEFSGKDVELMAILGNISQNFEEEKGEEMYLLSNGGIDHLTSKIVNTPFSPSDKGTGESVEQRSPLTELNL